MANMEETRDASKRARPPFCKGCLGGGQIGGGEVAACRRDILDRWHLARRAGLAADKAAKVVGIPRSTLFNWDRLRRQGCLEPRSRRPRRLRRTAWSAELVKAVLEARREQPMWGKAKIAVTVRSELPEGKAASESTVGRILALLDAGLRSVPATWKDITATEG